MTLPEVALYFRITVQTLRLWIDQGKIKACRVPSEKRDLNTEYDPAKPKSKWRPVTESQSTLYITWDALIERGKVYYKTGEKK